MSVVFRLNIEAFAVMDFLTDSVDIRTVLNSERPLEIQKILIRVIIKRPFGGSNIGSIRTDNSCIAQIVV